MVDSSESIAKWLWMLGEREMSRMSLRFLPCCLGGQGTFN